MANVIYGVNGPVVTVKAAKEFSMMELFLKNGSRILSKETLINKIWGYESDAENNTFGHQLQKSL